MGKSASNNLVDYCQPAVSKIDIYVTVVLNVVTDLYLISIPAPVSLSASMPGVSLINAIEDAFQS